MNDFMGIPWADQPNADPLADIRAMRDYVADQSGYKAPTTLIMSHRDKITYERFTVWYEETKRRLEELPRHRWVARMVLQRQLWGPWWKRNRRLTRLRWKVQDWRRGGDWDV